MLMQGTSQSFAVRLPATSTRGCTQSNSNHVPAPHKPPDLRSTGKYNLQMVDSKQHQ